MTSIGMAPQKALLWSLLIHGAWFMATMAFGSLALMAQVMSRARAPSSAMVRALVCVPVTVYCSKSPSSHQMTGLLRLAAYVLAAYCAYMLMSRARLVLIHCAPSVQRVWPSPLPFVVLSLLQSQKPAPLRRQAW